MLKKEFITEKNFFSAEGSWIIFWLKFEHYSLFSLLKIDFVLLLNIALSWRGLISYFIGSNKIEI